MVINSDHCDYRASYLLSLNGEAVLSRSFPVRWRSAGHVVFRHGESGRRGRRRAELTQH